MAKGTARFSSWKPSSWSSPVQPWLFWGLCLSVSRWNPIPILWWKDSKSSCNSLQAFDCWGEWCPELRQEPAICKEHLSVISDDVNQDHDSVLHIQKLISKHLEESNCTIKKMHEFKDRCAGQYKSRHCYGDPSCSLATLGYTVQQNYFATSHAKGEQDAAGSHVKQKAT